MMTKSSFDHFHHKLTAKDLQFYFNFGSLNEKKIRFAPRPSMFYQTGPPEVEKKSARHPNMAVETCLPTNKSL